MAGILWGLVLTILAIATSEHPMSRAAAVVFGVAVFILMLREPSGRRQLYLIVIYTLLCIGLMSVEALQRRPPLPPPPPPPSPPAEVSADELPGVYTGFRTLADGRPSHVVLTLESVRKEPSRMLCRYSWNEGLLLKEGEALVYITTGTLELKDGTRLRYRKENGKITLWSIMGAKLELSRWTAP